MTITVFFRAAPVIASILTMAYAVLWGFSCTYYINYIKANQF